MSAPDPDDLYGPPQPPRAKQEQSAILVIDNNSGRYSEFKHLKPRHLDNVAKRLEQLGCPVETQWIDMEARRAEKAARAAGQQAGPTPPPAAGR